MFEQGTKAHLIGIKGVGMTALAAILQSRGVEVTGSDNSAKFFTDKVLERLHIQYKETFDIKNISDEVDAVVVSGAYMHEGRALNNVEVEQAFVKKIPVMLYSQALGIIAQEYQVLAVAGSNGKSTTTALLGWVLEHAGIDPTVVVGTKVNKWESNARAGHSPLMIVEADEYRDAFLRYHPKGAIITNIDYDHPDYFKTKKSYIEAFENLALQIKPDGFLIGCGDDKEVKRILDTAKKAGVKIFTYGFNADNDFCVTKEYIEKNLQCFTVKFKGEKYDFNIPYPGKQYVLNSVAVFVASKHLGVSQEKIKEGIASFPGTARRLETLKHTEDVIIIDDYAHHPTAISVTLAGIKAMYPGHTLIALFQPHMFSRTQAFLKEFSECFTSADIVGIMEIYPSARETSGPVCGKDLADETAKHHTSVTYLPNETSAKTFIAEHSHNGNVIVLMGAGNVNDLVT